MGRISTAKNRLLIAFAQKVSFRNYNLLFDLLSGKCFSEILQENVSEGGKDKESYYDKEETSYIERVLFKNVFSCYKEYSTLMRHEKNFLEIVCLFYFSIKNSASGIIRACTGAAHKVR